MRGRLRFGSSTNGFGLACAAMLVSLALLLFGERAPGGTSETRSGDRLRWFGRTEPPADDVLRFANGAEPEVLDPALLSGQSDQRIARALFDGLVEPDPRTLEPLPAIARSWEVSTDGRTYVFHLRPDAVWTNGDRVTAGDFDWSWRRVLDPDTPARLADLLYPIQGASAFKKRESLDPRTIGLGAVDDTTFVVELENPTPYFLQLLTSTPFLPVHRRTVEQHGDRWTRPENIVSNGAFRLAVHRPNDRIVLERFERYWDASHVRLRQVIVFATDDLATMLNLYRAGITDWNPSGNLPAEYVPYVRRYADFRSSPFLATYFYSFNVTQSPLDDARVRRALALAVDREKITTYLLHESKGPWGNVVAPGFEGYPYPEGMSFDPRAARRLLAQAGYPDGRAFPRIEILFNTSQDHRKIAEAIQEMWKRELGIDVGLANQEFASYMRATTSLQYQVARRSWIADYADPNNFLFVLRTGEGNNRSGWSNARFDSLLAAAGRTLDRTERFRMLAHAEAIALDEMPFLPIYAYRTVELLAPYVGGWYPTAMDLHPLKNLWIERRGAAPQVGGGVAE